MWRCICKGLLFSDKTRNIVIVTELKIRRAVPNVLKTAWQQRAAIVSFPFPILFTSDLETLVKGRWWELHLNDVYRISQFLTPPGFPCLLQLMTWVLLCTFGHPLECRRHLRAAPCRNPNSSRSRIRKKTTKWPTTVTRRLHESDTV